MTSHSRESSSQQRHPPSDSRADAVRSVVAYIVGVDPETVTAESDLVDLGADSLQFLAIARDLEERFDIQLPRAWMIPGHCTIADLTRAVTEELE